MTTELDKAFDKLRVPQTLLLLSTLAEYAEHEVQPAEPPDSSELKLLVEVDGLFSSPESWQHVKFWQLSFRESIQWFFDQASDPREPNQEMHLSAQLVIKTLVKRLIKVRDASSRTA